MSLTITSLLLAIAPLFVSAFCISEVNTASAVAPSVQNLYHAALAETLVDSPQSLSSLEPTAGSSIAGQRYRYDNAGGSNNSSELEVSRGIFATIWRHSENDLPMGGINRLRQNLCRIEAQPSSSLRFLHCPSPHV